MAVPELVFRAHIEHRRGAQAEPAEKLAARHRFQLVSRAEVACHDSRDLAAVPLADPTERGKQRNNYGFACQSIIDPFAVAPALDKGGAAKELQVPGGVRHRQPIPAREVFDAPLALAEMFEQFQPMGVPEGLGDLGEADEHALLRTET